MSERRIGILLTQKFKIIKITHWVQNNCRNLQLTVFLTISFIDTLFFLYL